MRFTKALRKLLIDEVVEVQCRYVDSYMTFRADGLPKVRIKTQVIGPWLWVKSEADYEGATWDRTTDRSSGDPYSAHVFRDWVGKVESAPKSVSHIDELNRWALIHTEYERQYTDVGVWGVHTGRWIDGVTPDGIVTFRVESGQRFRDVSPSAETTPDQIDLNHFIDVSFDRLIQLLNDENSFVREMAIKQLVELGDSRAVDSLIQAADDDDKYVRKKAIDALGKLGGVKAIEKLISILIEREYQRAGPMHSLIVIGEPALDFLSPLIDSKDEKLSIVTIQIIEAIGGNRSYEILFQAIEDKRPSVRARVIDALPVFGNTEVVETLIEKLDDKDTEVQLAAVRALGQLHDQRAIEPLVTAFLSDDRYVRLGVVEALTELDWKPSNPEENAWYLFASEEWEKLVAMGDSAADTIIKALNNNDHYLRYRVLSALNQSEVPFNDPRAIELIIDIYNYEGGDQRDYIRREAIRALGRLNMPQVVQPLVRIYLLEKESYVRKAVFESISHLASSGLPVADTLFLLLTEKKAVKFANEELQSVLKLFTIVPASLEQIMEITPLLKSVVRRKKILTKTIEIAKDLLRLLDIVPELSDEYCITREKAAESLGEIDLPSVTVHLINALEDDYPVVRMNAAEALGGPREYAISMLISALNSKKPNVRSGAAEALGRVLDRVRTSRPAKPLLKALRDEHRIVRQNAAWALAEIRLEREEHSVLKGKVISVLSEIMVNDEYLPVRFNAVYALGQLRDIRVVEPLLKALSEPVVEFRLNATHGFVKMSQVIRDPESDIHRQIVENLIPLLSDDDDRVRYNATDALRLFGGDKAQEALTVFLDDDDAWMRRLVKRGIDEIEDMKSKKRSYRGYKTRCRYELGDPEAMEELISALRDDDEDIQRSAQIALGRMGQLAFDCMMEILQDKDEHWSVREGAAGVLGKIRDKRAVDALIEALKDEKQEIRGNAAWSLQELVDERSLKALIKATKDEFWMVRLNASAGLGKIGGRAAFEAMLKLLDDEHPRVREITVSYLGKFKSPRVVPALKKALKDEDAEVRRYAQQWLDQFAKKKKKKKSK